MQSAASRPLDGSLAGRPGAVGKEAPETDSVVAELLALVARERASHLRHWCRQDLSLAHLHVLQALEAEGSLPMSRLAGILDVSLSNATGIVGRMEDRGLARREHDEADRRVVFVTLTERGRQVVEDRQFLAARHLRRVLDAMPATRRLELVRSLRCFMETAQRLRQDGHLPDETGMESTDRPAGVTAQPAAQGYLDQ